MSQTTPSFHDSYLTGIQTTEGEAVLTLREATGETWSFTLSGLEALLVNDFGDQNIIFEIEVFQRKTPDRVALARLFPGPHPSAEKLYHDEHANLLNEKRALVESGDAALVSITPSCGADLLAFVKGVSLARDSAGE